jgi:hypothetical protein
LEKSLIEFKAGKLKVHLQHNPLKINNMKQKAAGIFTAALH